MCQINIAIFASGSGTNTENLIKYFSLSKYIKVSIVLSNKNDAYVLKRAESLNIPICSFTSKELNESTLVDKILADHKIDALILAGFLLKIPDRLIERYRDKILNIHPSLLPSFGGKGMYGLKVHKAVIDAEKSESGITIHLVDEDYDNGRILFQEKCEVKKDDTPETLASRIHALEYKYFPITVEDYLTDRINKRN